MAKRADYEILFLKEQGEFLEAQLAVNSILAVPFSFHKSVREQFTTRETFEAYLFRQASAMIEQFGDARTARPDQMN
jgi:hypothetical protein